MTKYINKKTGAIIEPPSPVNGGEWEVYSEEAEEIVEVVETIKEPEAEETAEDAPAGLEDITKDDIMQELDAMGIEYNSKLKKADLYKLMTEGA